jgi:hypothetical protein
MELNEPDPIAANRIYCRTRVLTTDGVKETDVLSSRQASLVGAHWNAVDAYLHTGNPLGLRKFTNVRIGGMALATDPEQIEAYARRELAIDDIYPNADPSTTNPLKENHHGTA